MDNEDYKKIAEVTLDWSKQLWRRAEQLSRERDELIRQLCEDTFSFTSWLQGFVSGVALLGVAWAVTCLT